MSFVFISKLLVLIALSGFPLAAWPASTVLVFGDSLSAGYGLAQDAGWVSLLAQRLGKIAPDYRVVNASISGETAAGGRRRIESALAQHKPAIVVLELGANDGLRGQPIEVLHADLEAILKACAQHNARVVLVGMRLPPNYGAAYVKQFGAVYTELANKMRVALVPFLFEGFGDRAELFQADGIHPTHAAQPLMLETVWRVLGPMLNARRPAASPR
ncbi:MAG: arylesterase [Burkholderiales bacterium]|nr:arylesterase [Burkholderiales bacterium]